MIQIPDIQYITRDNKDFSHALQAKLMFQKGIRWVQLRMKKASHEDILVQAREAMSYAQEFNGFLLINDSVEIAQEVKAHGIHLGLSDTPIDQAREILGKDVIIGGTANTLEDVRTQIARGADYVGLGPFRYTTTKENLSPVIGLEGYKRIIQQIDELKLATPLVAVGGILHKDIEEILQTGMNGVAISGALFNKMIKA